MILEDNASDSYLFTQILRSHGYTDLESIVDGLSGLDAILSAPPDLLLLDLNLPRLRGEEILRMIRSTNQLKKLPIIVISDFTDSNIREMEVLRLGADYYLHKPIEKDDLLLAISRILSDETGNRPHESADPSTSVSPHHFIRQSLSNILDDKSAVKKASQTIDQDAVEHEHYQGFELLEMIGSGGMGTVYKARQKSLNRLVALKVLMKNNKDAERAVGRFRRESRIMAKLAHRNIVQIIDAGDTPLTLYIAMEYMDCGTLYDRLKKGPLTRHEFQSLVIQSANALEYLHSQGVIHRDIKPGNVFLSKDWTAKLGDFGISRAQSLPGETGLVAGKREILGTPRFMAPELSQGVPADQRSDLFSLGRTLLKALLPGIRQPTISDIAKYREDIPPAAVDVLSRSTDQDPHARYVSVKEFAADMRTALEK